METYKFIDYCHDRHDRVCNQTYSPGIPYSFHLRMVEAQVEKFGKLLDPSVYNLVLMGAAGHDLIEDARVTYGDLCNMVSKEICEIIYLCTEMRGRYRADRKNDAFYEDLKTNKLAVFVKLCDIIANVKFGFLENSKQFQRAKNEYPKIKAHLYCDEFKPMFDYLESIFDIKH